MDFSKLSQTTQQARPVDPYEIFKSLPRLANAPNDLWTGQNEALTGYQKVRSKADVLIEMNTGAGKTLVGLLIAQSLLHEGHDRVVIACATIDLVLQTSKEAERIGLPHTTRVRGQFSNDLYESGNGFCITTYQALFNGLSTFRYSPPNAIVFDDAHVAEAMIRDALTLRVEAGSKPDLHDEIAALVRPEFEAIDRVGNFDDAVTGPSLVLAPAQFTHDCREQLRAIFEAHAVQNDGALKYAYAHLRDKLDRCAVTVGRGRIEIAPPFLPSRALPVLESSKRRVYLSATLSSKADFVRAFGKQPDDVVSPQADAGNGERLFLFDKPIASGLDAAWASELAIKHKVLIAVPTYPAAKRWSSLGQPPTPETFSQELDAFRQGSSGAFILVSRIDGIDLPHDTCRVMIIEGLPEGASALERFLWEYVHLEAAQASRMANRLVQLFGRINRGRNDYGVFFIVGNGVNTWLANDRRLALLPPLLRKQIQIGRTVQAQLPVKTRENAIQVTSKVLARDRDWLNYYQSATAPAEISEEHIEAATSYEAGLTRASEFECAFAMAHWDGDIAQAIAALGESSSWTANIDPVLAGWHNFWFAELLRRAGDVEAASATISVVKRQVGRRLPLPRLAQLEQGGGAPEALSPLGEVLSEICEPSAHSKYAKLLATLEKETGALKGGTPSQMEEATRALGAALGFDSTRPDNSEGTGPDVLWRCTQGDDSLGLELKTDKDSPATYFKHEIAQAHDSLQWMRDNCDPAKILGLGIVGPAGTVAGQANPADEFWLIDPQKLLALRDRLIATIKDIRAALPIERRARILATCADKQWTLSALFEEIRAGKLA
jgi:hypothetical protein